MPLSDSAAGLRQEGFDNGQHFVLVQGLIKAGCGGVAHIVAPDALQVDEHLAVVWVAQELEQKVSVREIRTSGQLKKRAF